VFALGVLLFNLSLMTMANGLSFISKPVWKPLTRSQRSSRAVYLLLLMSTLIGGCMFRLAQLQLVQGQYHRQLAEHNRITPLPIPAARGNILDRNGKLLASSRLTRSVYLSPRDQTPEQWQATVQRLGTILEIDPAEILKKIEERGFRSAMPVRIYRDLTPQRFVALAEAGEISGLEVRAEANRYYPNGNLAAHVLGYIGEATANEMKKNPDFPAGMLVGQFGLERIADQQLRGSWGNRLIEVNAEGKEVDLLGEQSPKVGADVPTTLDVRLQAAAEKALNNRRGAVVVINVKTGEVLALASGPTFDPNLFTRRISQKDWDALQGQDKPFLNRALQGYPPASTFKIVTAVAGMQSGKFSPDSTLMTYDALNIGGTLFHEHGGSVGTIGFPEALAVSSNTFFYQVGMAAGPEEISKWGHRLGIGSASTMDLDGGNQGLIPTPDQKQKLYQEPWYVGDTVTMAIGQGIVQVTPLEEAVMVSTIANGGWRVKPHLLASQTNTPEMQREKIGLNPETIATVKAGLIAVVREGTARSLNDGSIPPTAGKTGTAEVPGQEDNSMYVGFGPVNDPQIAIAVVVENGGFGAVAAVPIAHEIYQVYFGKSAAAKLPAEER
jgi:penicillin-binding protein 2